MIIKSKKTRIEQEVTIEQWETMKSNGMARKFVVIDFDTVPKKRFIPSNVTLERISQPKKNKKNE